MTRRWANTLACCAIFLCLEAPRAALTQNVEANQDAQRFIENCASCHGTDGRGGEKAAAVATTLSVLTLSDKDLIKIVHDGTASGMPPFAQIGDANIAAVVRYLRTLTATSNATSAVVVTGNVEAGRGLYFGNARCSTCHTFKGAGGFIASDLTAYARSRTPSAIVAVVIAPDSPLAPGSQVVDVVTKSGQKITGVLRNEDSFSLALQAEDGRYYFLARSSLRSVRYTGHSLMPHDFGILLTPAELNDIASFLVVASRAPEVTR